MINKLNKIIMLAICVFLTVGCSDNRFKKNWDLNIFSFGLAGYNAFKFCSKMNPKFLDPYPNGVSPSKRCIRYQYYTCHHEYYCNGDKQCEKEAAQFWTPLWDNAGGNLQKRIEITDHSCVVERQRNT